MPTKVTIELVSEGILELLTSDPVSNECRVAAQRVASAAGEGFEVVGPQSLSYGRGRAGWGVSAETYEAKLAEATDKVLSKAVSACRS